MIYFTKASIVDGVVQGNLLYTILLYNDQVLELVRHSENKEVSIYTSFKESTPINKPRSSFAL